jgi:hypothetical protein
MKLGFRNIIARFEVFTVVFMKICLPGYGAK